MPVRQLFSQNSSDEREVSGFEVIKLEFILRLKIKCNDWLIADTQFYNLEARSPDFERCLHHIYR